MISKTNQKNSCSFGSDTLAYLYNEMPAVERDSFELHLADCGTCIDDFAALSQSRYPVYVWKTTEFEPLPTPRIVIPYSEDAAVSILDRLKAALAFNPRLTAFAAFATMLVAAFVGYAIITNSSIPEVSESKAEPATPTNVETSNRTLIVDQAVEASKRNSSRNSSGTASDSLVRTAIKPRRAALVNRPPLGKTEKNSKPTRRVDLSVPVLSRVEDDEDESIRLADIFDEIGSSE